MVCWTYSHCGFSAPSARNQCISSASPGCWCSLQVSWLPFKQYRQVGTPIGTLHSGSVTDQPLFYIALVSVILGVMLFLAGFIGELVSRNSNLATNTISRAKSKIYFVQTSDQYFSDTLSKIEYRIFLKTLAPAFLMFNVSENNSGRGHISSSLLVSS